MKKYTKILGIFLCLAMIVGILPIAATADPETTTWLDMIAESTITPHVGYYVDGDMENLTDEEPTEAEFLTNGSVSTGSWMHGADWPIPDGAIPAAVLDLGETKTIGGLDLVGKPQYGLTSYEIEVLTESGWTDIQNPVTETRGTGAFVTFDPVACSQVRILISAWTNQHPMLQEVTVFEVKTSGTLYEIPVASVSSNKNTVSAATESVDYIIDNDRMTIFQTTQGNLPAEFYFNTTNVDGSANNFSRMVIYAYGNNNAPSSIAIAVKTSPIGEWTEVYTGTAYAESADILDTAVIDLAEAQTAFEVKLTVNTSLGSSMVLNGVELFGNGETYELDIEPSSPETEPTAPETEPTAPEGTEPSQEPTEPATALPEAPVVTPGNPSVIGVPKTGKVYKMVSAKAITTLFGYYGDRTGADESTFVDGGDGECVTDGWFGRDGYSQCTSANGLIAAIMTINETKTIGGFEIVGSTADNNPVDFEVQAWVNGTWVTVLDIDENIFTNGLTKKFTFPAVETNKIRVLVNKVAVETNKCYIGEISLFEVTDGKLYNQIDLTDTIISSDGHSSAPGENLINTDKAPYFLGANITLNLTGAEGNPTAIDGLALYCYRGNSGGSPAFPNTVNVLIQKTAGGEFESIGVFNTNWVNGAPLDSVFVEFDQTYVAYAVQFSFDQYKYISTLELFQYQQEEAPVEPENPTEPSEPTEPSAPATEPSAPATEPSAPATEPSAPATEPSAPATEPSAPATEPSEPGDIFEELDLTEIEATFALIDTLDIEGYTEESIEELAYAIEIAFLVLMDENLTQEMIDEANAMLLEAIDNLVPVDPETDAPELPDVPALPSTDELFATISTITNLNPAEYTAESYAALIEAVDIVNAMIREAGGAYTQAMLDEANAILTEALSGLVKIGGEDETPNDGEDSDDEIPGGEDSDDENDLPADTGDVAMIILSGMMALSTVGGAAVIGKKKFF